MAALPVLSGFEKVSFLTSRPALISSVLATAAAWMFAEPEIGHYAQHIGATILIIPFTILALNGSAMRRLVR